MSKAWGYIRVSKDDQENSIAVQTKRISDHAVKLGVDLPPDQIVVDEDVSGSVQLKARPGGKALWDSMSPGDTVMFLRVDRVFRSMSDAATTIKSWAEQNVRVVFVDLGIDLGTAAGRMFFHQLAAFAEFEREMISIRTKETLAKLKASGRKWGSGSPHGWLWNDCNRLVVHHEERKVGKLIVKLLDEGHSLRQVCWKLMQMGVMKPMDPRKKKGPLDPQLRSSWLSPSRIHALAIATRAGFPVESRSSMTAAYLRQMQISSKGETPSTDPPASPSE